MEYAPNAYKALNGVFCIYKPEGMHIQSVVKTIKLHLTRDLNGKICRPPKKIVQIQDGNGNLPIVTTVPDIADHTLVVGPRYLEEDLEVNYVNKLAKDSSGIQVMGIGRGTFFLRKLAGTSLMRVYHIKARLGMASDTGHIKGKLRENTTYGHVTQYKLDKTVASVQAGHQKNMFVASKVNMQSQKAYDLAVAGLLRPTTRDAGPVIYGMKCIQFNPPDFTLEIHAINERCDYLTEIIHDLGLQMKTSACVVQIRRIRYGHFMPIHALLQKHWHADEIVDNIRYCKPLVDRERLESKPLLLKEEFDETKMALLPPSVEDDEYSDSQKLNTMPKLLH